MQFVLIFTTPRETNAIGLKWLGATHSPALEIGAPTRSDAQHRAQAIADLMPEGTTFTLTAV